MDHSNQYCMYIGMCNKLDMRYVINISHYFDVYYDSKQILN